VRFGHGHLKHARFHLLRIRDAAAALSWLGKAPVTTAVKRGRPETALQLAFTYEGLKELGAAPDVLKQFPYEFITGMAEESRSRRLGDVAANHPETWLWGYREKLPHVLVLLYAETPERLEQWETTVRGGLWDSAFSVVKCLPTNDIGDIEPFGFADGTSQPLLDWERLTPARRRDTTKYTNVSALGEFLLGYPNEYGRYTDRPLLAPDDDPEGILPLAEDIPGRKDFGRNGTYLVLRDLAQDVPAFWKFTDAQSGHRPAERRKLARSMVGRMILEDPTGSPPSPGGSSGEPDAPPEGLRSAAYRPTAERKNPLVTTGDPIVPSGDPIVPLSALPIAGVGPKLDDIWHNQFTYHGDPDGTACPYGAHIRRANPRNADLPEGTRGLISRLIRILGFGRKNPYEDLIASTRFHRILRRGREYGPRLKPEEAVRASNDESERGLRFICLNANISRQFEFIQASWLVNPKFDGLDEGDPLIGNRAPESTDAFTIPQESGLCRRIHGLPQFVTVRGGAYFFMPGLSALRYMAQAGGGDRR
jgi:deferrochelatase/peroxidase EfeB